MRAAFVSSSLFLLASTLTAAWAQDSAFGGLAADSAMGAMLEANRNRQMGVDDEEDDKQSSRSSGQPLYPVETSTLLNFKISTDRRAANYRNYAGKIHPTDATARNRLLETLTKPDRILAATPNLNKYGLRTDNIADAYTYWLVRTWQLVNANSLPVTKAQFSGARNQASAIFGASAAMAYLNDSSKQEMADNWWLGGLTYDGVLNQLGSKPDELRAYGKKLSLAATRLTGTDLTRVVLTDAGFKPRAAR